MHLCLEFERQEAYSVFSAEVIKQQSVSELLNEAFSLIHHSMTALCHCIEIIITPSCGTH